jgi:hypothetical protein
MTSAPIGRLRRSSAATLVAGAALFLLTGCSKPGWLTDFENTMNAAIPTLTQAMDSLAADLPKLVDPLDKVLADQIKNLDSMLREQIDGLNIALDDSRGQLDLALMARTQQIAAAAKLLATLVGQIARREQKQLAFGVENLLATTDAEVGSLLTTMRVATRNVRQVGDQRLAEAYSITQDLMVRVAGGILLLLGLIGGAIVCFVKAPNLARGFALAAVAVCMGAGIVLLASGSLRGMLIAKQTLTLAHAPCPGALVTANGYLLRHDTTRPLPGAAVVEGAQVIRRLLVCMATATVRHQLDQAQARLASIRHLLKIDQPCQGNADCPPGRRCQRETATCTDRCASDQSCDRGLICHDYMGKCLPLCDGGGTRCPSPAVCAQGRCVAPLATPPEIPGAPPGFHFIPGGKGYARAGKGWAATLKLLPALTTEADR